MYRDYEIRFEPMDWPTPVYVSEDEPSPDAVDPIENWNVKPVGGLWTAPLLDDSDGLATAWTEWMNAEQYVPYGENARLYALEPRDDVDLFVVDSLDAAKELYAFGDSGPAEVLSSAVDYEAIVDEYDGVRLTHEGQIDTRLSWEANLNGWDCASTVWFDWCFESVEDLGPLEL